MTGSDIPRAGGSGGHGTPARPVPLSLVRAALRVCDVSLGEMLWSRRTVFMALVAGGPVVLALCVRLVSTFGTWDVRIDGSAVGGASMFGLMIWVLYLRFTVPILGVFYGTALIADEVEDRTLTYLFTRPIARGAVLLGKYLAYLICTTLVVLPSVVLLYLIVVPVGGELGGAFPDFVVDLALLAVGLAVYGAVFAWVGVQFRRPLVAGLVFVIGWEPAVVLLPGYLKHLTVAYHLQALVPHAMPQAGVAGLLQSFFTEAPQAAVSLAWLAGIWAVFLFAAVGTVGRREYVLDR